MTGGAVLTAAKGGAARRRVQTMVIFLVLTAAAAAGTLGLTLATNANAQFLGEFTSQHGAHLAVTIDAAKVTPAQLARTAHLPGVTQAAGPYPETAVFLTGGTASRMPAGHSLPSGVRTESPPGQSPSPSSQESPHGSRPSGQPTPRGVPSLPSNPREVTPSTGLAVVGRASPSGPLDNIIVRKGRWATRPGEIVIDPNQYGDATIGGTVTVTSAPGQPKLTVVGLALSVTEDQEAWVVPSQLAALRAKGAPVQEQMLYTFTHAATTGQVSADLAELKAALPAGAVTNSVSWLDTEGTSAARTGTAHLATGQAIHMTVGGATVTAKITGQVYAPGPLLGALLTSEQTFTSAHASLPVRLYQALIRPGTGQQKYQAALSRALGPGFTVIVQGVGIHGVGLYGLVDTSLIRLLTILVAVLAGLGVLNSVLMLTRERVHDLGIFKAVGMTPRRPSSWSPAGSSSPPSLPRSSPCPPGWPCKTRLSTPSPGPARFRQISHLHRQPRPRLHPRRARPPRPGRAGHRDHGRARARHLGRRSPDHHRPPRRIGRSGTTAMAKPAIRLPPDRRVGARSP